MSKVEHSIHTMKEQMQGIVGTLQFEFISGQKWSLHILWCFG